MSRFNMEDKKVITGIDLGTSHIRCVIGVSSADCVELVGAAQIAHKGLSKGRIVNMKETAEAIRQACEEAEVASGLHISQLFLAIGGDYQVFSSQGMSLITSGQVTTDDLNKAVETAKAVPLSTGHRLLHVLPKIFTVDGQGAFFNPLGLSGLRLETKCLMVSVLDTGVQNALQCLRYAGYSARGLVLQSLAVTLSVVDEESKSSGVCVLDIGHDQTSFIIICDSRIHHIGSIAIGGEDFTHDLMRELKIPRDQAERLKLQYNNTLVQDSKESVIAEETDMVSEESHQKIHDVLNRRSELLFQELKNKIEQLQYYDKIESGVILTGRGSYLPYLNEGGKSILEMPVRKSCINIKGVGMKELENKNDYETALGILLYAQNEKTLDFRSNHLKSNVFKFKRWMKEIWP